MPTAVIATATLSSLAGSPTKVEPRRNRRPRLTPPSPPPISLSLCAAGAARLSRRHDQPHRSPPLPLPRRRARPRSRPAPRPGRPCPRLRSLALPPISPDPTLQLRPRATQHHRLFPRHPFRPTPLLTPDDQPFPTP